MTRETRWGVSGGVETRCGRNMPQGTGHDDPRISGLSTNVPWCSFLPEGLFPVQGTVNGVVA